MASLYIYQKGLSWACIHCSIYEKQATTFCHHIIYIYIYIGQQECNNMYFVVIGMCRKSTVPLSIFFGLCISIILFENLL